MKRSNLLNKPLAKMTGREFMELSRQSGYNAPQQEQVTVVGSNGKHYVYGILGLAQLFGCSKPTAIRIKQSCKIDGAITQIGRKIIIDADLALQLASQKTGGRRNSANGHECRRVQTQVCEDVTSYSCPTSERLRSGWVRSQN